MSQLGDRLIRFWHQAPYWLKALLLILILQLAFWRTAEVLGHHRVSKTEMLKYRIGEVSVAKVPDYQFSYELPPFETLATTKASKLPRVPPESLRHTCVRGSHHEPERIHFKHDISLDDKSKGMLIVFAGDNVAAYANNRLIALPSGKFDDHPSRDARQPNLLSLPHHLLKEGENSFDIIVRHNGCYPILSNVFVGDYATLLKEYKSEVRNRITLPWIATGSALMIGLAALLLLPLPNNRLLMLGFGIFMVSLAFKSYNSLWNDWRYDQAAFMAVGAFSAIFNAAAASFFIYIIATKKRPIEAALLAGVTLVHLLIIGLSYQQGWMGILNTIDTSMVILSSLYMLVRLIQWFREKPQESLWILTIFSLLLATNISAQVTSWLMIPMTINVKHILPLVLVIGLGLIMLYRGYNLYREAENARASLTLQVAQKEAEIRESYLKLREQEKRNTVMEERQRLIEDMHDGIGGQLMSLLVQVKSPKTSLITLPPVVQAIIDDLRLIIDSMDSVGDRLEDALKTFRDRMSARLKMAGIDLKWENTLAATIQGHRPQEILHIYRILQESCTNALKHAEAKEITICLGQDNDPDYFTLSVTDNGKGIERLSDLKTRGMVSMKRRATALGGKLRLESALNKGTQIILILPYPRQERV